MARAHALKLSKVGESRKLEKRQKSGGRVAGTPNKSTGVIRELAAMHVEDAIKTLVDLMQDEQTPPAARVSASKELIERGFGRSGSFISLNLETPLSEHSPSEAIAIIVDKASEGALSTEEAQRLVGVIEARMKAIEHSEFERRLSDLEQMKETFR